jgi:putative transposase
LGIYSEVFIIGGTANLFHNSASIHNTTMESFFYLLKCESVHLNDYKSYEEVAQAAAHWIDYYNKYRIKQKLDGKSPVVYRLLATELSV